MIAAFATDDGATFIDRHFGDARHYDLYAIEPEGTRFLTRLENTVDKEEDGSHADPRKAQGIAALLWQQQVHVAVARVFGGNLKRIRRKFVCVLPGQEDIPTVLALLQTNLPRLLVEWAKGEERDLLRPADFDEPGNI